MLKIGLITKDHLYAVDAREAGQRKVYNFSLSTDPDRLSFLQIFQSAFATPARYVMEIFRRLHSLGSEGGVLVFNPAYPADPTVVQSVYGALAGTNEDPEIIVFSDRDNCPIAYHFPGTVSPDEARFLSLVSTVYADADTGFLRNVLLTPAQNRPVPASLATCQVQGPFFCSVAYRRIYAWITHTAQRVLKIQWESGALNNDQVASLTQAQKGEWKAVRDAIPFAAINPYHAGDVLFLALALRYANHFVSRAVVNSRYLAILQEVAPDIVPVVTVTLPPNREGRNISEEDYFPDLSKDLPVDAFYIFCRVTSDYHVTSFHLIDHLAFSVGADFRDAQQLVSNRKDYPVVFRPECTRDRFRILLHVDAGWRLKHYPERYQRRLIELLHARGCEVTVLGNTDAGGHGADRIVRFEDMDQFRNLLQEQHLLIGTDSFPSHYAVHVLGLPTICLFSSTKPVNSCARQSDRYRYLERGLSCKPCYSLTACEKRANAYCDNFTEPEQVCEAAIGMLDAVYPLGPVRKNYPAQVVDGQDRTGCLPTEPITAFRAEDELRNPDGAAKLIQLSRLASSVSAAYAGSRRSHIGHLAERYAEVLKREGFMRANWQAVRHIARSLAGHHRR
jgi:hypothetical protein